MNTVRAKMKVTEITQREFGKSIKLTPVYSSDPESENGKFYKQTPGGSLDLSTVNDEAAKQFEVGKEYYIDITKAE